MRGLSVPGCSTVPLATVMHLTLGSLLLSCLTGQLDRRLHRGAGLHDRWWWAQHSTVQHNTDSHFPLNPAMHHTMWGQVNILDFFEPVGWPVSSDYVCLSRALWEANTCCRYVVYLGVFCMRACVYAVAHIDLKLCHFLCDPVYFCVIVCVCVTFQLILCVRHVLADCQGKTLHPVDTVSNGNPRCCGS